MPLGRMGRPGLIGMAARTAVVAGTATAVSGSVQRHQQEKAQGAAERIDRFVAEIEQQIGWTTHAQWSAGSLDQRRYDFVRLLRQVPAITELVEIDGKGREQLKVSRLAMDVVASGSDYSTDPRFAKKQRPVPKKPGDKDDPEARRGELQDLAHQRKAVGMRSGGG